MKRFDHGYFVPFTLSGKQKRHPGRDELQNTDAINAWTYETNRNLPLKELRIDSETTFQQLLTGISALPQAE